MYRIIKVTRCTKTRYIIEKRCRFLFWTYWTEVTESVWDGYMSLVDCIITFNTIDEAKQYICELQEEPRQIVYEV